MKNKKTKTQQYRNSRSQMFFKISARKSFANPTGYQACTLIENRPQHWCSPMKSAKFSRTTFLTEHPRWLFPTVTTTRSQQQ